MLKDCRLWVKFLLHADGIYCGGGVVNYNKMSRGRHYSPWSHEVHMCDASSEMLVSHQDLDDPLCSCLQVVETYS